MKSCTHQFQPEKIYKDGKLHRDSSQALFHQCELCGVVVRKEKSEGVLTPRPS